jgi:hypothetical protein
MQIEMAFSHTIIERAVTPYPESLNANKKGRAPNCHYYLQRAVTPIWMGSIALL